MDRAPTMAATVIATSPTYPKRLSATPPSDDESNTTNATPSDAPLLTPKTDGPARGLRNTVCICNPLTDRPAPANKAVLVCGMREFHIILLHIVISSSVYPSMGKSSTIPTMASRGMDTVPMNRFATKSTADKTTSDSIVRKLNPGFNIYPSSLSSLQ